MSFLLNGLLATVLACVLLFVSAALEAASYFPAGAFLAPIVICAVMADSCFKDFLWDYC